MWLVGVSQSLLFVRGEVLRWLKLDRSVTDVIVIIVTVVLDNCCENWFEVTVGTVGTDGTVVTIVL